MSVTLLFPKFTDSIPNKFNKHVEAINPHKLKCTKGAWHAAISSQGFSTTEPGTFVFATSSTAETRCIGFTGNATLDPAADSDLQDSLCCCMYVRETGGRVFTPGVSNKRKTKFSDFAVKPMDRTPTEVVAIFRIGITSDKEVLQATIQFIADGKDGVLFDASCLLQADEIFPFVAMSGADSEIEIIPLATVKDRQPAIELLLQSGGDDFAIAMASSAAKAGSDSDASDIIAQLQRDLAEEKETTGYLADELDKSTETLKTTTAQLIETTNSLTSTTESLATMTARCDDLSAQLNSSTELLIANTEELKKTTKSLVDTTQSLVDTTTCLTETTARCTALEKEIEELKLRLHHSNWNGKSS